MKSLLFALLAMTGGAVHAAGGVQIDMLPMSPIVFTGDYTYQNYNGETVTVQAPWFQFKLHVYNQATDPLLLVGLRVEVSGIDNDGQPFTQVNDFHPADFNGQKCQYADFGKFDPAGTPGGPAFNDKNLFLTPLKGSAADCYNGEINIIVGDNPALQKTKDGDNYKYHVRVRPLGWFDVGGSPKARYDDFVETDTQ